jgi:hypothetical protein
VKVDEEKKRKGDSDVKVRVKLPSGNQIDIVIGDSQYWCNNMALLESCQLLVGFRKFYALDQKSKSLLITSAAFHAAKVVDLVPTDDLISYGTLYATLDAPTEIVHVAVVRLWELLQEYGVPMGQRHVRVTRSRKNWHETISSL